MSVLIKGMEMPKRCEKCRCCKPYEKGIYCTLTITPILGNGNARLNNCPLIEVPEDVQPVVRCINCKYYEGLACCKLIGDCGGTNWFCGWGEPKEET